MDKVVTPKALQLEEQHQRLHIVAFMWNLFTKLLPVSFQNTLSYGFGTECGDNVIFLVDISSLAPR
jgi:hypothetical protein